jgi:hypothetical protein
MTLDVSGGKSAPHQAADEADSYEHFLSFSLLSSVHHVFLDEELRVRSPIVL